MLSLYLTDLSNIPFFEKIGNNINIFFSEIKNIIPMNRLGKYQDLFALIRFLIDDQSNFITGQNIFVDGGRTII